MKNRPTAPIPSFDNHLKGSRNYFKINWLPSFLVTGDRSVSDTRMDVDRSPRASLKSPSYSKSPHASPLAPTFPCSTPQRNLKKSSKLDSSKIGPSPSDPPIPPPPNSCPVNPNPNSLPVTIPTATEPQPDPLPSSFSMGPFPSQTSRKRPRTKSPSKFTQPVYPVNFNLNLPPPPPLNPHPPSSDHLPESPPPQFQPSESCSEVIPDTQSPATHSSQPELPPLKPTESHEHPPPSPSMRNHQLNPELEATVGIASQLGIVLDNHIEHVSDVIMGEGENANYQ